MHTSARRTIRFQGLLGVSRAIRFQGLLGVSRAIRAIRAIRGYYDLS